MVLSVDPPWKRPLAVFSRLPPTGVAEEFVDVLRRYGGLPAPTAATDVI